MSRFPNQVGKRQLKFGEFVKKQLLLFQATTHQKEGILAAEALAINKTANAYALSQIDEHEIPALSNNQHSCTASRTTESTVNHSYVVH